MLAGMAESSKSLLNNNVGFVPQKFLAGISSDIKDSRHND